MKKVININFQGRIILIEEDAYEQLKNYVESLRQYFVNEEKIARKEAFIAIKKANLFESIDTITRGNYAHLFNS